MPPSYCMSLPIPFRPIVPPPPPVPVQVRVRVRDEGTVKQKRDGTGSQWDRDAMGQGCNGTGLEWDRDVMGQGRTGTWVANRDSPVSASTLIHTTHR